MIIKNADVQTIIGVEANAIDRSVYHILTLTISAKDISPEDFENLKGKLNLSIDILEKD